MINELRNREITGKHTRILQILIELLFLEQQLNFLKIKKEKILSLTNM